MSVTHATPPSTPLRVAAAQAPAKPADLPANVAVAARLAVEAADQGARLLVLPELFLSAYDMAAIGDDPAGCGVRADRNGQVLDARLDPLREAAAGHDLTVVVSAPVRAADERLQLASLLVTGDGEVRDVYHKQNLIAPAESDVFVPGESGASVDVAGWRFGLGICYDGCFPEHARAAAVAGAHGYLCPAAYPRGGEHRRDLYYAARALDNTFFVVLANAVDGPAGFSGGSAVYDPEGRVLGRAPDRGEAMIVADLDPALMAATRADHTMLADHLKSVAH